MLLSLKCSSSLLPPSQSSDVHYGWKLCWPWVFFSFDLSWVQAHSITSCVSTLSCCVLPWGLKLPLRLLLHFNEVTLKWLLLLVLLFIMPDIKPRALCLWRILSASGLHLNSLHFSEYYKKVTCNLLLPIDLKLPNGGQQGCFSARKTASWFNWGIIFQECWLLGWRTWSHKTSTTI